MLGRGVVHVYRRDTSGPSPVWVHHASISNPSAQLGDPSGFGASLEMGFGLLAIGAPHDDEAGVIAGAVYEYDLTSGAPVQTKAIAGHVEGEEFGAAVAWFGAGYLIGAPKNDSWGSDSGLVYHYGNSPFGAFEYQVSYGPGSNSPGLEYGSALAYDDELSSFANGRFYAMGGKDGRVHVYRRTSDGAPVPNVDVDLLGSFQADSQTGDLYGAALAMREGKLLIGAPGSERAYSYGFDVEADAYLPHAMHTAPIAGTGMGAAVAVAPGELLFGTPTTTYTASESGAVQRAPFDPTSCPSFCDAPLLAAVPTQLGDGVGSAVGLTGNNLLLGLSGSDHDGADSGQVVALHAIQDCWAVWDSLSYPGLDAGDEFGAAIDVHGDYAIAGAPADQVAGTQTGSAHVWRRHDIGWVRQDALDAFGLGQGARFGQSVGIAHPFAFVGFEGAGLEGGVRVFEEVAPQSWVQRDDLYDGGFVAGDRFGAAIAADGPRLAIGVPGASADKGLVRVYTLEAGAWTEREVEADTLGSAGDQFGAAVALDGERLAIGIPGKNEVRIYEEQPVPFLGIQFGLEQVLSAPLFLPGMRFGSTVQLDGDRLLVSAPGGVGISQGLVYTYVRVLGEWELESKTALLSGHVGDDFGIAADLSGERVLAGSPIVYGEGAAVVVDATAEPADFEADRHFLSLTEGGDQFLSLNAGAGQGGKPYWILGSLSGSEPGTPLFGQTLPLVADAYFQLMLSTPQAGPVLGPIAILAGAEGKGIARFRIPTGLPGSLAGLRVHHAYMVLGGGGIDQVSSAVHCDLVP